MHQIDPAAAELTQHDAAAYLALSVRTLQRMRERREGPPYRRISERKIRYPKSALDAWLGRALVVPAS